jgi:hypothetical protein
MPSMGHMLTHLDFPGVPGHPKLAGTYLSGETKAARVRDAHEAPRVGHEEAL